MAECFATVPSNAMSQWGGPGQFIPLPPPPPPVLPGQVPKVGFGYHTGGYLIRVPAGGVPGPNRRELEIKGYPPGGVLESPPALRTEGVLTTRRAVCLLRSRQVGLFPCSFYVEVALNLNVSVSFWKW